MTKRVHRKKLTMKTELGLQIETTRAYKDAEHLAKVKEEIEDRTSSLKRGLENLLKEMDLDKVTSVVVKAPGGTLYKFRATGIDRKIKISKAPEPESPVFSKA